MQLCWLTAGLSLYCGFINVCLSQGSTGNSSGYCGMSSASAPWHLCPGGQQGLAVMKGQQGQGWEPDWPMLCVLVLPVSKLGRGEGLALTWLCLSSSE